MKSSLATSDSSAGAIKPRAEALGRARTSLSEALAQLDSIEADTAIRARLQGLIDEIAGVEAGESTSA